VTRACAPRQKGFGDASMWTFLKEAIGRDLTRITFPVR
jgi:hypothetical protein